MTIGTLKLAAKINLKRPGWIHLFAVFALWLAAVACYAHAQKPVSQNNGLGWDGSKYHQMYQQALKGESLATEKPFAYRVATPWLASRVGLKDARMAFHVLNLGAVLITGCLLFWIMGILGAHPGISLFLVGTFFLQWHGPLRQQFYDSFGVDAASQPFTCLIFLIHLTLFNRTRRIVSLAAITFAGVFFRESVLFAALAVWIVEAISLARAGSKIGVETPMEMVWRVFGNKTIWIAALPLAAGLAGISVTRQLAEGIGPYSFLTTMLYYLYHKPPMVLIHSFYNGYGTALIPLLIFWRRGWTHIKAQPLLACYPVITFFLGWTAGGDTTRINYWGALALLPLMALVLSEVKLTAFPIGILLALEVITTRMFFPIPDYPGPEAWRVPILTNWGSDFPVFDLWSELANPRVLMISLAQYGVLTVVVALWMNGQGLQKYLRKGAK